MKMTVLLDTNSAKVCSIVSNTSLKMHYFLMSGKVCSIVLGNSFKVAVVFDINSENVFILVCY